MSPFCSIRFHRFVALPGAAIVLLLLSLLVRVIAQPMDAPYDYPVKPGTAEWARLQSHAEKVDICQIPSSVLSKLTTKALVQSCVSYPLYPEMNAYDGLQKGMEALINQFNGLQELLKREDAGEQIMYVYESMDPETDQNTIRWRYVEMIVGQVAILRKMSQAQRLTLLRSAVAKYDRKKRFPTIYSSATLAPSCILAGRIMRLEGIDIPANIDIDNGLFLDAVSFEAVRGLAKKKFGL